MANMKPEDIPSWAVDRYRYYEIVDNIWYDDVFVSFISDAKDDGLTIDKDAIRFSGFCSQGDGASFTGHVIDSLSDYMTSHTDASQFPFIAAMAANEGELDWSFNLWRTSNHYSHEFTVSGSLEIQNGLEFLYDVENPMVEQHLDEWTAQFHDEQERLEQDMLEFCRAKMKALYRQLRREYDYLTSDAYIRELLTGNPDIWQNDLEEAA